MTLTALVIIIGLIILSYVLGVFVGMHIGKPKVVRKTKKVVKPKTKPVIKSQYHKSVGK